VRRGEGRVGVGVPLSLWKKESRNGMKRKGIEGVFHCKTTGLRRSLNGAMKEREREESNAQALGSRSSALGAGFFRVACNFMCAVVASICRLHLRRYGGEDAEATGRKWSLGAGGRDFQERRQISKPARFRKKRSMHARSSEKERGRVYRNQVKGAKKVQIIRRVLGKWKSPRPRFHGQGPLAGGRIFKEFPWLSGGRSPDTRREAALALALR
jgi:hypothetical protein